MNNFEPVTEAGCIAYFNEKAKVAKPSTLWTEYSMLNYSLMVDKNINIKEFRELAQLLKELSFGYESKKSKVFSMAQILKFLNEAPDDRYLMMKVTVRNAANLE